MSAGATVAIAAMIQAVRAIGVIVKVEPPEFLKIVEQQSEPLIVHAPYGVFGGKHAYLVSHKGLAFYTHAKGELRLPANAEIVNAKSIYIPG
jgi:hypothetical protein